MNTEPWRRVIFRVEGKTRIGEGVEGDAGPLVFPFTLPVPTIIPTPAVMGDREDGA